MAGWLWMRWRAVGKAKTKAKAEAEPDEFDRDRYCTPGHVMADVRYFWTTGIGLDVCGDSKSVVHPLREFNIRKGQNALVLDWGEALTRALRETQTTHWMRTIWVQPPYSNPEPFMEVAVRVSQMIPDVELLALIPGTPATKWWSRYVTTHARAVCLWGPERINFLKNGIADKGTRQESTMVLLCSPERAGNACYRFNQAFGSRGMVSTRPKTSAWEWHTETPLEALTKD